MRKATYIILCFLCLYSVPDIAQNKPVDSLIQILTHAKNDIDRARALNALADEHKTIDPVQMQQYANQALQLAQKIKYRLAEGNAHINLGNANLILGKYTVALQHFSDAQAIFEAAADSGSADDKEVKNGLARAYGSIGIVFSEQSNYAKALQYHLKAVRIYEEINDLNKCARLYNNIGIVYQSEGDYFKALDYFIKCLKIQEKIGDNTVGITTTNIGNIYLAQKNYPKAFEYYTKARQLFVKYPDSRGLGELYNNLGLYYKKTGDATKALENYQAALSAFNSIADKFGASDTYAFIGEVYFDKQDYVQALSNINKSLALAKELNILERIQDSEKKLSEIYVKLNKPNEALLHYQLYSVAKDSVSNYENIRNSVRAEMNFEFDKKQALQKKELEKKELIFSEQNKRHQQQIFFVILFILLLFGIIFLIYNRLQLKKTLTLQKELAEYEQKALHLQMNPHFVFNCLGSISSFIVQNGTDSAIKYLSKFSKLMRLTLEYSKESLIPIDKEIESLQNYLELEQLRFNQKFDFSITKSKDIDDDTALPPLLLQPFVENAIIHGLIPRKETGKIDIDFSISGDSLICTITDNGIGFNKSQELKENLVSVHKSMALDITKKRLEMMESVTSKKSQVEINEIKNESGETTGTKVILSLPIQYIKA
ncbi:MAG TPA: tetratricopeptide repeat protein [Flavobacterium sp.]|nr:tetratricopeptide repeat protein [Flavobacterium sp.]